MDFFLKGLFSILLLLLSSCTSPSPQPSPFTSNLSPSEKVDLQQFFHSLLIQNYGVYVLFGSKPLCEFSVLDMNSSAAEEAFEKFLEGLSDEEREKINAARLRAEAKQNIDEEMDLESSRFRGFLTLRKLLNQFKLKGYLFRAEPMLRPDAYRIHFINIQNTAIILAENYEIFRQAAQMEFHPLQIVFEAEDPNSPFWKKVMSKENHLAKGLLFGFGRKNALFGQWKFAQANGNLNLPDEKYRNEIESFLRQSSLAPSAAISLSNNGTFSIPHFGFIHGDKTAENYEKERLLIEENYRKKEFLEVTLKQLFEERGL